MTTQLQGSTLLDKRIDIPCCNSSSPPGLVEATTADPWQNSGKYALGWVYFAIILLVLSSALRWYHYWNDKISVANYKGKLEEAANMASPSTDHELSALATDSTARKFFPREGPLPSTLDTEPNERLNWPFRKVLASVRFLFYRPIPNIRLYKRMRPVTFPSPGVCILVFAALAFVVLYCFLPQPLFWESMRFGSPPLAIRSGMLAVSLIPWIVALSMKANFITILTSLGHERLNVLHRWLAYICLLLSLIHAIPFYVTPANDEDGHRVFETLLRAQQQGTYIYGTGNWRQMLMELRSLTDSDRNCCPCANNHPLRTFHRASATTLLRNLRHGTRAGLHSLFRHAILALQQLPNIMELPMGHHSHLAGFVFYAALLSKLDEPIPSLVGHW